MPETTIGGLTKEEIVERVHKMTLLDDALMTVTFKDDIELVQFVLRIILNMDDLIVVSVHTQDKHQSQIGKSVIFDVKVKDSKGRHFDIEIQRANDEALMKRARYYQGVLDGYILKIGQEYKDLPDTYIIFIMEKDIFGLGWAVYEVERYIKGTDKKIEDGSHLIFVNASVIEDSPIGRLMADMREADPKKMNYSIVAEKVDQIKNGKGGYENMCAFSERMIAYGEARGRAEGEARGFGKVALRMLKNSMPVKEIQLLTELSLEQIQAIAKQNGLAAL